MKSVFWRELRGANAEIETNFEIAISDRGLQYETNAYRAT